MTIVLVVEDGTGVAGANTYADAAYARSFAESVGLVLPTADAALAELLTASMAYVESRPYLGQPSAVQALYWPRKLVLINGDELPHTLIPQELKKAQVTAAAMIGAGTDLLPTIQGQFITEDTVGPLTTKFSDEYLATPDGRAIFQAIDVYLKPLCIAVGGYALSPKFGF